MKLIKRKLRSKGGASMIIALVFMLFTSFVGGSVLVSATANAYRVAQMAEQQAFLNERSAALLLGDEIQLESGQQFRLHVVDADVTTRKVKVLDGGGVEVDTSTAPKEERVITFQLVTNDTDVTELQQLMAQTTVWRYLREHAVDETCKVEILGFGTKQVNITVNGTETTETKEWNIKDFWYVYPDAIVNENEAADTRTVKIPSTADDPIEGSFQVTGTVANGINKPVDVTELPAFTAHFSSGKGTELYDFHVDFGELSQLRMTVNAYAGTSNKITVVSPAVNDTEGIFSTSGFIQVTSESTQTTISWDDPMVEKGGAEG